MREKHELDVDWMTTDFDTATTYAACGGVRHGRYFILSIHFISMNVIVTYCLYADFLSTTVLWTTEVIVGSHHPLWGPVGLDDHLHETRRCNNCGRRCNKCDNTCK
jgi:hypothetical protein